MSCQGTWKVLRIGWSGLNQSFTNRHQWTFTSYWDVFGRSLKCDNFVSVLKLWWRSWKKESCHPFHVWPALSQAPLPIHNRHQFNMRSFTLAGLWKEVSYGPHYIHNLKCSKPHHAKRNSSQQKKLTILDDMKVKNRRVTHAQLTKCLSKGIRSIHVNSHCS